MDTVKGIVMSRRTAIGTLVVLLIAGVAWGVMSRGPSEAERAYALACDVVRENLKDASIPSMRTYGVEVNPNYGVDGRLLGYQIQSRVNDKPWSATVDFTKDASSPHVMYLYIDGQRVTEVERPHRARSH